MPRRRVVASGQQQTVYEFRVGTRLWLRDSLTLNHRQKAAWMRLEEPWPVKEILLDGAIRSGKTQIGMKKIVKWAMKYPRTTWVMMRSTKQELEDSTKKILLEGVEMPPVLAPQLVAYQNETYNYVKLINGSEIQFRSLEKDQRGKIRNATYAGMLIDQAEEMDTEEFEEYYIELLGRLSDPRTPRKMILIANPGPATHWIARRFGCTPETDRERPPMLRAQTRRVHLTILDNAHNLHPDYLADLLSTEETRPDYFRQMVMGEWGSFGGKRFKCWRPEVHVMREMFEIPSEWEIVEGIDWGNTHKTVCVWFAIAPNGRWYGVAEHAKSQETVKWHAERILATRRNNPTPIASKPNPDGWEPLPYPGTLEPSATFLSPDAWNRTRKEISTIADSFAEHGVYAARAQNERKGGWNRIEEMLTTILEDGLPQLQFFPTCRWAITELPNLTRDPKTDDVMKENDDAADAVRYAIMSRMPTPAENAVKPVDRSPRAMAQRLVERRKRAGKQDDLVTRI